MDYVWEARYQRHFILVLMNDKDKMTHSALSKRSYGHSIVFEICLIDFYI